MHKWKHDKHGRLLTPRHYSKARETADAGIPWALDNDGFAGFNENKFREACETIRDVPGCKFITAPDVFNKEQGIGLHAQTLDKWKEWRPYLQTLGQPLAFVAQNGATINNVPWDELDAVFIGGSTEYKLGPIAAAIVQRANELGKWAHVGRVNSEKRIAYAKSIGANSVDGSGWARFRNAMMPRAIRALETPTQTRLNI